jgi:hypothetical protein
MISSATEIVHALGALPWLVGRSHECDYPEEVRALPVCTAPRFAVDGDSREIDRLVRQSMAESISAYQVFDDVLERLQPTHILTQIHCEVCAVSLRDVERSVAARLASRPAIVSLQPSSLAGSVGRYPARGAVARHRSARRATGGALAGAHASDCRMPSATPARARARLHRVDRAVDACRQLDARAG